MKIQSKFALLLFVFFYSCAAFSQINSYTFKRKLNKVDKEDYYSIPLMPEVIGHCKSNTNDLRLYNIKGKDTTELPYIYEWMGTKNEQITLPFELINDTYNEKCCSYITLKFNKKETINQIKLEVSDFNFDKNLQIEGSTDNKQWFTIKEHLRIVRFQNSENNFSYTTLNYPNAEYNYFRLKFDDDASKRIEITHAYAFENRSTQGFYTELKNFNWKQTNHKKEKTSEILVDLPSAYLVNYITLKSKNKTDFYRNINVYASSGTYHTPKGDLENWYLVNTSVFSSIDSNSIDLNNQRTKKLKIEIINYDNEPIEIGEIKAYAEQCRVISNLPVSDNIYLAYGKENDGTPTYDLVHFKEKIPTKLSEINYGAEQVKLPEPKIDNSLIKNKKWLWIAMGVIILIIGYFALTMLKKEQN